MASLPGQRPPRVPKRVASLRVGGSGTFCSQSLWNGVLEECDQLSLCSGLRGSQGADFQNSNQDSWSADAQKLGLTQGCRHPTTVMTRVHRERDGLCLWAGPSSSHQPWLSGSRIP